MTVPFRSGTVRPTGMHVSSFPETKSSAASKLLGVVDEAFTCLSCLQLSLVWAMWFNAHWRRQHEN